MDYSQQILKALEDSNTTFADFKAAMSARIDALETAEAKAHRPRVRHGGTLIGSDDPEVQAMKTYMRSGQIESKSMSTGSGPDGGYTVPKVIDSMVLDTLVNISPIRSIATVQQVSTQDFHKLVNTHGTSSGWMAETAPRPATNTPKLVDIAPPMGDLYANPQASQQMLDDAMFNAEQWLAGELATEFARAEGAAFIGGSGVSQPIGFLSGSAPVATADGSRPFGTLQYIPTGFAGAWPTAASAGADLLLSVIFSLKAGHRRNASWVMSKSSLQTVSTWKDSSGRYILTPMTQPGIPATIFGYPVVEAEDMPAVAANSLSVAFGDFRAGYLIVDRIGTRIVRDPFTNKPFIGFYSVKRVGGTLQNSEAIKVVRFSVT